MTGRNNVLEINNALIKDVSDLRVFQSAYAVSLEIHRRSKSFPADERYDLISQMRRASKSICANLAEGYEKQQFSKAEFKRFVTLALGSCGEMRVWIRYARDLGYIDEATHESWLEIYRSISRMLQKLHQHANTSGHPVIRSSGHHEETLP